MAATDPIVQMVQDPDFGKLPISEQRKALTAHDPSFANVDDGNLQQFVGTHQRPQTNPLAPPEKVSADNLPGSTPLLRSKLTTVQPTQFEKNGPANAGVQTPNSFERGMGLPGPISDVVQGAKQLVTHPINSAKAIMERAGQAELSGENEHATPSPIVDAIKNKEYGSAAALAAGGVVGGLALGRLGVGKAEAPPMTKEAAVNNYRRGIGPQGTDLPSFNDNLAKQIDTIVSHGRENGVGEALANAKTPADAMEIGANHLEQVVAADPYYNKFIKPNVDAEVGTTQVPNYRGGRTVANHATIGQLSSRLRDINAQLFPKYQKGGAGSQSAVAAVNAADVAPLQAEAAGIRQTLVNELSRKTGIPAEQIEPLRANYGQLTDLADTARYYASNARAAQDAMDVKPTTFGDVVPKFTRPTGALDNVPVKPKLYNSSIQGNMLRDVYLNYPGAAPVVPDVINPPEAPPRPSPPYDPNTPPTIIPTQVMKGNPPTTPTGRPLTVRAQRAAASQQGAEGALRSASPTTPPPSISGIPEVIDRVLNENGSKFGKTGSEGIRVPKQLPPGPSAPLQLPERGAPIALPPSSIPQPIARALTPRNLPIPENARAAFEIAIKSKRPFTPGVDPILRNVLGEDYPQAGPRPTNGQNGEERINVIHPSGTPGNIPISQLREALGEGYTLAHSLGEVV